MHPGPGSRLAASAALLCGVVAAAQQPSAPTFRSRVDAIEIEMRAVNSAGEPITDLDRTEIDVLEDGRRQEIIAFTRVSLPVRSAPAPSGARPAAVQPPPDVASNRSAKSSRIFVLILDDLHVDRRNSPHVKQTARRFVEQYVAPEDLVSVVYTGVRPDAAQDFTSDRSLLLAAIDKFVGRKLQPATVERMEQYNLQFRGRGAPRFEDLRDRQDAERAFNARSAMASIESVSALLARVNGRRKAAVYFSEGLDYDLSGLRSRGRLPAAASGPTVLQPTVPTGGSETDAIGRLDVHSHASDVLLALQTAVGAASRANVAIYPMDVHGTTSDGLSDLGAPVEDPALGLTADALQQETRDAQETLTVLAENTGGFAALTPSSYEAAFSRIVRESSEYYLVAYSPWNPAPDGTYREITVRVKRPGVSVSARKGYYAPRKRVGRGYQFVAPGISDDTSVLVMAPIQAAGLPLDVHTLALKRDKKTADVVVTAYVDGAAVAGDSARPDVSNTLELALMAIDSAGKVQAATGRAIDVRLDAGASRLLRDSDYRVVSRLQVPAGRYQIRQAVRERNGGRQGSVFADLEVPDFSRRLAMSGILLASDRTSLVPTSVDRDIHERLPVLPSARRAFSPDDELRAAVEVYAPSGGRDVHLVTTIVDGAGRERFRHLRSVARTDFKGPAGACSHAVQIPLTNAVGDLMLVIEARPIDSPGDSVTRRVPFAVTHP